MDDIGLAACRTAGQPPSRTREKTKTSGYEYSVFSLLSLGWFQASDGRARRRAMPPRRRRGAPAEQVEAEEFDNEAWQAEMSDAHTNVLQALSVATMALLGGGEPSVDIPRQQRHLPAYLTKLPGPGTRPMR